LGNAQPAGPRRPPPPLPFPAAAGGGCRKSGQPSMIAAAGPLAAFGAVSEQGSCTKKLRRRVRVVGGAELQTRRPGGRIQPSLGRICEVRRCISLGGAGLCGGRCGRRGRRTTPHMGATKEGHLRHGFAPPRLAVCGLLRRPAGLRQRRGVAAWAAATAGGDDGDDRRGMLTAPWRHGWGSRGLDMRLWKEAFAVEVWFCVRDVT
jgi:hypothetical protein